MFGCFSPVVTINTSAIDSMDCNSLEKLIILDKQVPSNRTLFCANTNRLTVKTDYYGQEYLRGIYDSKCLK